MFFTKKDPSTITLNTLLKYSGNHAEKIDSSSILKYKDKLSNIFHASNNHGAIDIILPGFPYKSANTKSKVIGKLPDLGEEVALSRIEKMRKTLSKKLDRPVRFIICSDGFAFNDIKEIMDTDVLEYRTNLISMTSIYPFVEIKSLHDLMSDVPSENRRVALMSEFGTPISDLKKCVNKDSTLSTLYNNLTIFARHDLEKHDKESKREFKLRCKDTALNVVARSKAWSGLIAERYPNAIRLTIHPYNDVSDKFPISLLPSIDGRWRTPWHNAPIITGSLPFNTTVKLAPKKDAENADATLGYKNNHPWCYTSVETKIMEETMMCNHL